MQATSQRHRLHTAPVVAALGLTETFVQKQPSSSSRVQYHRHMDNGTASTACADGCRMRAYLQCSTTALAAR